MNKKKLRDKLKTMTPLDVAIWLEEKDASERAQLIGWMTKDELAEVFRLLSPEAKEELLEALTDPQVANLIRLQESDDLVDTLQEMPANLVIKLLEKVPAERRTFINKLLQYPEESVGSLMSIDFVTGKSSDTKDKLLEIVQHSSGGPEHLNQIYIIDEERHLIGFVYLSDLIKIPIQNIENIIHYSILSVKTHQDQEVASDLFMKYQLLALPVVDSENRLVGIITADDIFAVISDEIHEDYTLISGVMKTEDQRKAYQERTIWSLSKDRISWLLVIMITATITAYIIQYYDEILASHVILAAYIPMLMDSGGNSGTQSSTLITRALSTQELGSSDMSIVIQKEGLVGTVTGAALAIVNFFRTLIFDDTTIQVAFVVSLTLLFVIIIAKIIGGILPILAEKVNQDPAVMAGPLITTIVDTVALIIYFQIASLLLGV